MKKRMLALLLAIVMVVGLFTACGKQETPVEEEKAPAAETEKTPEQAPEAEAPEELSFPLSETYNVTAFSFSNTGNEIDKTLTMQVMEERTNIHFDITTVSDAEMEEKRNLSFNGGEYYDVYLKSGIGAVDAYKYGSQGVLIPLNDLIDQYMPNLKAKLDEQGVWNEITSPDGNIYALPQLNGAGMAAPSTFIHQTWMDNLGLEMPTTPEAYMEVLRAFVNDDPNGNGEKDEYGIYCPAGAVEYTLPVWGVAMDYNTMSSYDGANMTYIPTSDVYKDFLAFWAQAYAEGLINQDCFTATWDDINAIGAIGDVLGTIPTWGVYQHVGVERDEFYQPLMPFNDANSIPVNSGVQYGALCITDKCTNPELICMWADYFYCEEGAILAGMGVEGETFTLNDDGTYQWILNSGWGEDADAVRNSAVIRGWYPVPMAKCNLLVEGVTDPEERFLTKQREQLVTKAADYFPALSWTEEELEEKSMLVTTINGYYYEYMAQVITGQLDLEESWDDYLANMEGMGVARLNEIDKAAYDRWLAEQG